MFGFLFVTVDECNYFCEGGYVIFVYFIIIIIIIFFF